MKPHMSDREIAFFDSFFSRRMTVFEWGAGGSTVRWAPETKRWISVEHDDQWRDKVLAQNLPGSCTVLAVDLDDPEYPRIPHRFGMSKIDVFLIDGRRRMECRTFLEEEMLPGSLLLVHDAIRYEPSGRFGWWFDVVPGLKKGNHKGVRIYGKFEKQDV